MLLYEWFLLKMWDNSSNYPLFTPEQTVFSWLEISLLGLIGLFWLFRPSSRKLWYFSRTSCRLGLSFSFERKQNSMVFVDGNLEKDGIWGWGDKGRDPDEGFISRSCCGWWVTRRWAASRMRSQLLDPDRAVPTVVLKPMLFKHTRLLLALFTTV